MALRLVFYARAGATSGLSFLAASLALINALLVHLVALLAVLHEHISPLYPTPSGSLDIVRLDRWDHLFCGASQDSYGPRPWWLASKAPGKTDSLSFYKVASGDVFDEIPAPPADSAHL